MIDGVTDNLRRRVQALFAGGEQSGAHYEVAFEFEEMVELHEESVTLSDALAMLADGFRQVLEIEEEGDLQAYAERQLLETGDEALSADELAFVAYLRNAGTFSFPETVEELAAACSGDGVVVFAANPEPPSHTGQFCIIDTQ